MDPTPLIDAATPVRWVGYLALFPLAGTLVLRRLVQGMVGQSHPVAAHALIERARTLGLLAGLVLMPSLALRLYFQVRSFALPGEPLTWSAAQPILESTSWGHGWEWQAASGLLALCGLFLAGRHRAGWTIAALAVVSLIWAFPLTGHAAEHRWGPLVGVGLQGLHLGGGVLWLGSLSVMMAVVYRERSASAEREEILARLVKGYSPLALTGAAMVAGAGVLLALSDVASWSALASTTYGRVLLLKLALLGGIVLLGYHNWRRVRPALGTPPAARRLARSASLELLIGTLVLAATATLVALPAPGLN